MSSAVPAMRSVSVVDSTNVPGSPPIATGSRNARCAAAMIASERTWISAYHAFRAFRIDLVALRSARCQALAALMRTKDQVRRDVWKAMDREGVSRFPGAEGRIPNFAGAKLAAEKLAGAPALEARAGDQGQPRLAPDPRPPDGAGGGQDADHGRAPAARHPPLPAARPDASSRRSRSARRRRSRARCATARSSPRRSCPRSTSSSPARSRSTSAAPGSARAAASPTSSTGC